MFKTTRYEINFKDYGKDAIGIAIVTKKQLQEMRNDTNIVIQKIKKF